MSAVVRNQRTAQMGAQALQLPAEQVKQVLTAAQREREYSNSKTIKNLAMKILAALYPPLRLSANVRGGSMVGCSIEDSTWRAPSAAARQLAGRNSKCTGWVPVPQRRHACIQLLTNNTPQLSASGEHLEL